MKIRVLRRTFSKDLCLSHAEDNTTELLNRGSITDLPLLRILLNIFEKSRGPSLWEAIASFILSTYAGLEGFRNVLQSFLACLNFTWAVSKINVLTSLLPPRKRLSPAKDIRRPFSQKMFRS